MERRRSSVTWKDEQDPETTSMPIANFVDSQVMSAPVVNETDVDQDKTDAFEEVLKHIGGMGRYQKLLFLSMLPFGFLFAFIYFVQMFITVTPATFWCNVPGMEHLSMKVRRNLTLPPSAKDGSALDPCRTFDVDWAQVIESKVPPSPYTRTVPCKYGWDYDYSDVPYATITTERAWVCDKASYVPAAQSVFFLGAFLGTPLFGWLADAYGRVPALVGANLVAAVGGILTIFTMGIWDFVLCRFIVGLAYDNCFMILYILVLEYVGPDYRSLVANLAIALFFGGGCVMLPVIALLISDWRMLLWVTSTPLLLAIGVPWCLPESARWLVSRGRVNDALKILRNVERFNKSHVPKDVMKKFVDCTGQPEEKTDSLISLFRSVPLRYTMLVMAVVYLAISIIYDGLVRLSDAFGLNFFLTFALLSATEIPAAILLAFMLDRWGRRALSFIPLALAGVSTLGAMTVPKGIPQAVLGMMARLFVNMCYNAVIQWSTELLPTTVRASGSATLHMTACLATTFSPFIVYSQTIASDLPLLILGIMGLIAAGAAAILPETSGLPMPLNIPEGEKIIIESRICGMIFAPVPHPPETGRDSSSENRQSRDQRSTSLVKGQDTKESAVQDDTRRRN